jgi:hypothetical protein
MMMLVKCMVNSPLVVGGVLTVRRSSTLCCNDGRPLFGAEEAVFGGAAGLISRRARRDALRGPNCQSRSEPSGGRPAAPAQPRSAACGCCRCSGERRRARRRVGPGPRRECIPAERVNRSARYTTWLRSQTSMPGWSVAASSLSARARACASVSQWSTSVAATRSAESR